VILMKIIILLTLALNAFHGFGIVGEKPAGYSQIYVIFINGDRAGKETVTEKIDDNGDRVALSDNEIYLVEGLKTNRMAFSTRMVLDDRLLKPKSYEYKYDTGTTGDSCNVVIRGTEITRTLNRGGATSTVTSKFLPDMVILDFNVYHQYDYLVRKYDSKKGGRQLFSDFIPLIGNDIPIALTFLGDSDLSYGNESIPVKNYKIEFVGLRSGTVTTDRNGRLVRLMMPDQNLEVVRDDLIPQNR